MHFRLNETQEACRAMAREFAEREITPIALERDRMTLIFGIPNLIAYSQMTLEPGDLISTGSCDGAGIFRKTDPTPYLLKVQRGRSRLQADRRAAQPRRGRAVTA